MGLGLFSPTTAREWTWMMPAPLEDSGRLVEAGLAREWFREAI
jgi:hypothetical protein